MLNTHHPGAGGMTGATGDLVPDEEPDPFIPAEIREIADPELHGHLTVAQHDLPHGDSGQHEPGDGAAVGSAPRDGGYGSAHGLSADDPAYRMKYAGPPRPISHRPASEDRIGGDQVLEHEERF